MSSKRNLKSSNLKTSHSTADRKNTKAKAEKNKKFLNSKTAKINTKTIYKNPYLIPILFTIAILPLIVRMHDYKTPLSQYRWFSNEEFTDFFLFYKHWLFVITSFIMCFIIIKGKKYKSNIFKSAPIFIPLAVYALSALLSSFISKYRGFSFTGIYEQFESIFAILGYCFLVYYIYLFVQTEQDIAVIIKWLLISSLILSLLGLTQLTGHDFFGSDIGTRLITSPSYWGKSLTLNFKKVYLTFYNPNYVGFYVSLVLPILITVILLTKKSRFTLLYLFAALGLILSLSGSGSTAGFIGVFTGCIFLLIFFWRYYLKYYYISIPAFIIAAVAIICIISFNGKAHNYIIYNFNKLTNLKKSAAPALSDIQTNDKELVIVYNNNKLITQFNADDNNSIYILITDENGESLAYDTNPENAAMTVQDKRFPGFVFTPVSYENIIGVNVLIDGHEWFFTNQIEDGTFYYLNRYGKFDKIISAPSALFTGYEQYASGRGYLWAKTIPLLKKHILFGSGADTFALEFPQQDYVNAYNFGYGSLFISKPHSLYLQIGVQTGVISLLAYLIFYIIYFISSIRLYIKGLFKSYYAKTGLGIFIGTFSYMICSITNDSSITVAPVFWALIGLGIVINHKAKPLIEEEIKAAKL
jgi:hypothetical protein